MNLSTLPRLKPFAENPCGKRLPRCQGPCRLERGHSGECHCAGEDEERGLACPFEFDVVKR